MPREQLETLKGMNATIAVGARRLAPPELFIDAILGYGQHGIPRGGAAELAAATCGGRVLALDVPSGLDLERGTGGEPAVHAEATLTLALPKATLRVPAAGLLMGELYLADISIPAVVYRSLGIPYRSPGHGHSKRLTSSLAGLGRCEQPRRSRQRETVACGTPSSEAIRRGPQPVRSRAAQTRSWIASLDSRGW